MDQAAAAAIAEALQPCPLLARRPTAWLRLIADARQRIALGSEQLRTH